MENRIAISSLFVAAVLSAFSLSRHQSIAEAKAIEQARFGQVLCSITGGGWFYGAGIASISAYFVWLSLDGAVRLLGFDASAITPRLPPSGCRPRPTNVEAQTMLANSSLRRHAEETSLTLTG